ncbi:MAG: helix-turn-helix transcriptional regulator [Patescibacteria group bacterium]|nr:helix-turn-helix transcriptional regulator [Patescibacteria group bacterium]
MSQGDIVRVLEVHRAYVSGIETGKRNPALATIERLADALGVSASELLK